MVGLGFFGVGVVLVCFLVFFETVFVIQVFTGLMVESGFQRPGVWNIVCNFGSRFSFVLLFMCFHVRVSYMHCFHTP